jgi:hypothetical protein
MSLSSMFSSFAESVKAVFSTKPVEVHIEEVAVTPIAEPVAEKPAKVVKVAKTVNGVKPAVAAKAPRKPRTPKAK